MEEKANKARSEIVTEGKESVLEVTFKRELGYAIRSDLDREETVI